ncbi:hypothetical protein HK103_004624 [Boothiomyces macroporosus]|uniref:Uncharacterized protein n=1 Tax=Boothiomyces macroporosus TaxID=261099 RepID=A0AAD5Y646_9FUNG|nr:hypothetical protein HK103_004624 [Boothiomyces macroporosus]
MEQLEYKTIYLGNGWQVELEIQKAIGYGIKTMVRSKTFRKVGSSAKDFKSEYRSTICAVDRGLKCTQSYRVYKCPIDPHDAYRPSEEWYNSYKRLIAKKNTISIDNLVNK